MRRRQFIGLLGGGVALRPFATRAQQAANPLVGFLNGAPSTGLLHMVDAVRQGIKASNENLTVTIESRWAAGDVKRLPELAAALVRLQPAVIVAGGHASALAAQRATTKIPIVFFTGGDLVGDGLVTSLARPGGNATGVTMIELGPKRLELMRELVPQAALIAVLQNPTNPATAGWLHDLEAAGRTMGQKLVILEAATPEGINTAFATLVRQQAGALLITIDATFNSRRDQLIALAAHHRVPAIYYEREFASSGGLISYGADYADTYRQLGGYVARLLQGAKAIDLPVQQPTKFQLAINLKTAKSLGLSVPPTLLVRATEVIE
jgi:putative ABC transport system substrate-binding protein